MRIAQTQGFAFLNQWTRTLQRGAPLGTGEQE